MADDKFVSRMLLIGIAVVVLAILVAQYFKKNNSGGNSGNGACSGGWSKETFVTAPAYGATMSAPVGQEARTFASASSSSSTSTSASKSAVVPSEPLSNEMYKAVNYDTAQQMPGDCVPRDKLTVEDLLPKDAANSKWAQVAPAGQGSVTDQNFLTAGYLVGVNTVGQSMRNANMQLRSDPPIDRVNIGPWNQTTIEYDNSRRFFEIGSC